LRKRVEKGGVDPEVSVRWRRKRRKKAAASSRRASSEAYGQATEKGEYAKPEETLRTGGSAAMASGIDTQLAAEEEAHRTEDGKRASVMHHVIIKVLLHWAVSISS